MKKRILTWAGVLLLIGMVTVVWATDIKDDMSYKGARVDVKDGGSFVFDNTSSIRKTPTTLSFVSGTGYTVTGPSAGNIFIIPTSATDEPALSSWPSGVTVIIPAPSATTYGWEPTIINQSGTSPMVLYIDGTKLIGASGTTEVHDADAAGDSYTLSYCEETGVTVYVKCKNIN